MPLVTVLLPFNKSKKYLTEAIESILNQTFKDIELLLLDDGSTDDPHELLNEIKDSRIRYFREEINRGIVFQLNKGISLARGKYIARMDADDIALSERIEKQISFMEEPKNSGIDVLGSNAVKIGDEVGEMDFKNYKPNQISFLLNFYCPLLHPTVMMRKSIFFDKGLRYSEEYKYAEDYGLWRMVDNGKNIAILSDQLLAYRIHNDQTNKDLKRIETQRSSCVKVASIRSVRFIERFIFTLKLKNLFIDTWFGNQNDFRPNYFQRNYIKIMKRILGIKSEFLNNIIYK